MSLVDKLVSSAEEVAASLASLKNSSNSVSTDHIMSTKWSPKIAAFEGRLDDVEGRLDKTEVTNSTKATGDRGLIGVQVDKVAHRRVWYAVVRISRQFGSVGLQWGSMRNLRLQRRWVPIQA